MLLVAGLSSPRFRRECDKGITYYCLSCYDMILILFLCMYVAVGIVYCMFGIKSL